MIFFVMLGAGLLLAGAGGACRTKALRQGYLSGKMAILAYGGIIAGTMLLFVAACSLLLYLP